MAPERGDTSRLSDTEGGERPVREKLQKAHITHDTSSAPASDTMASHDSSEEAANGNEGLKVQPRGLQKKRSYEEIDGEHARDSASAPTKHHTRKRSRDSTVEEDQLNNGRRKVSGERARNGDSAAEGDMDHEVEADSTSKTPKATTPEPAAESRVETTAEDLASPKTKRSRLLSDTPAAEEEKSKSNGAQAKPQTEATTKIPATSGFANASATSPFGALAGSKSPEPQSSASAFAASGFGALSGSSASGFGSVAKGGSGFGTGGGFGSGAKSPLGGKENETTQPSAFGGALGQSSVLSGAGSSTASAFGSGASGFGKIGSSTSGGFGRALGGAGFGSLSGGGLSSFASGGKGPAPLGTTSKAAKSFGAPAAEDDEKSDDGADAEDTSGLKSPLAVEEEKQDERFYEQSVETGEEDETTDFSSRAKLYNFTANAEGKKEWRERGLGVLRLNVKKLEDDDEKAKARLLMRADGSHRVVLNTPIMKDMKFGTPTGGPPQGGYMLFMGTIEGSTGLELLQVKVSIHHLSRCLERVTNRMTR